MANISLEEVKEYLRMDDDAGDQTLAILLESAKEYLANAGVTESNHALYKLAVMVWVAIHYEMDDRTLHKLKQSLQTMILQLREVSAT
ncbi:head-tail connector protein [Paenibacillus larvae]|uniref:Head-tail connector complex protein n=3 Tax=Fernvirus jacopo TaxID=2845738 RepID=A0A345KQG7_9CAUD|nr:head-tail connector protein [Paenibacillus larvae]AXF40022.1 head-tail connector complex protein [Paenibacillus phage Bloom]AXH45269.1 head-tail connector complex protein [Paenibacillus phage Arcticfreeze]AXH45335.1 head-tail connector complex protein [Paenibacillus phage DevRi]